MARKRIETVAELLRNCSPDVLEANEELATGKKPKRVVTPPIPPRSQAYDYSIITLKGYRPPSLNSFYAGMHYRKRKAIVDSVHKMVMDAIPGDQGVYEGRVDIAVRVYFKSRPHDSSNVAAIAKMCEDGLVMKGVLKGDTIQHVRSMTLISDVDRDDPRVEIHIKEARKENLWLQT